MEKLIIHTMENPTPENKRKVIAYDRKHPFASCFLPRVLQCVLAQYHAEATHAATKAA